MYKEYCSHKEKNIKAHLSNKKLTKQMQKELKDFLADYSTARHLSVPAQESYVRSLAFFGQFLADKRYSSYKQAKTEDIKTYLGDPYPKNGKKKSESILVWVKSSLKIFYRWLLTGRTGRRDPYPELVNGFSVGVAKGKRITDKDIITPEEFKRMLDATRNSRDRAFVYMLYETGCRVGELLEVKIEDVHFDSDKSYFDVSKSKTEPRRIFIFDCVRDLKAWMNQHPHKNKPDAWLFTRVRRGRKESWSSQSVLEMVKRVAVRAGMKKKVWCHLFRHTAATNDARSGLPEDLARIKYGWGRNSRMFDRYRHRNAEDVMKWEQQRRGMEKDKVADPQAPRICGRCAANNDWTAKFCDKCGMALDQKALQEYNEAIRKAGELNELRLKKLEEKVGIV
jgi:site-specific recombinase XerD